MRRGQTLVATLIVIAILAILAVVFLKPSVAGGSMGARKDGRGTTIPGLAKAKAEDEVCKSNLSQVRQAIVLAQSSSEDDALPSTLQELRLGESFYKCPMDKKPYSYDPQTGKVQCLHPGHEKY